MSINICDVQDHIIATQLRRLQHQLAPISDVYHERRLGLGLAPTLSSLLMEQAAEQQQPPIPGKPISSTSDTEVCSFWHTTVAEAGEDRDPGDGGLCSLLEELAAEESSSCSSATNSAKLQPSVRVLQQAKGTYIHVYTTAYFQCSKKIYILLYYLSYAHLIVCVIHSVIFFIQVRL
jgi:hypothetical protein